MAMSTCLYLDSTIFPHSFGFLKQHIVLRQAHHKLIVDTSISPGDHLTGIIHIRITKNNGGGLLGAENQY